MPSKTIIGHGLNTTSLKDGDMAALDDLLGRYVDVGCSHVELVARRLDLISGGRILQQRAYAVLEILNRHNITPTMHAPHALNFMDLPNIEMHRAVAECSIELANRLGVTSIVIHSGRVPEDVWQESRDDLLAKEREELKRLGELAAKADVRIAVENLIADPLGKQAVYGADPRALNDQLSQINHPAIGGCLDFGHAFLSAPVLGFDYIDAISTFSEQVWHLHLHDNGGLANLGHYVDSGDMIAMGVGDTHMPMGWGNIPWAELLPCMKFREGTCAMIELNGRFRSVEDMVSDTAYKFANYWNGEMDLESTFN